MVCKQSFPNSGSSLVWRPIPFCLARLKGVFAKGCFLDFDLSLSGPLSPVRRACGGIC